MSDEYKTAVFAFPYDKELTRQALARLDERWTPDEMTGISLLVDNRRVSRRVIIATATSKAGPGVPEILGLLREVGGDQVVESDQKLIDLLNEIFQRGWNAMTGNARPDCVDRLFVEMDEPCGSGDRPS